MVKETAGKENNICTEIASLTRHALRPCRTSLRAIMVSRGPCPPR